MLFFGISVSLHKSLAKQISFSVVMSFVVSFRGVVSDEIEIFRCAEPLRARTSSLSKTVCGLVLALSRHILLLGRLLS